MILVTEKYICDACSKSRRLCLLLPVCGKLTTRTDYRFIHHIYIYIYARVQSLRRNWFHLVVHLTLNSRMPNEIQSNRNVCRDANVHIMWRGRATCQETRCNDHYRRLDLRMYTTSGFCGSFLLRAGDSLSFSACHFFKHCGSWMAMLDVPKSRPHM